MQKYRLCRYTKWWCCPCQHTCPFVHLSNASHVTQLCQVEVSCHMKECQRKDLSWLSRSKDQTLSNKEVGGRSNNLLLSLQSQNQCHWGSCLERFASSSLHSGRVPSLQLALVVLHFAVVLLVTVVQLWWWWWCNDCPCLHSPLGSCQWCKPVCSTCSTVHFTKGTFWTSERPCMGGTWSDECIGGRKWGGWLFTNTP